MNSNLNVNDIFIDDIPTDYSHAIPFSSPE